LGARTKLNAAHFNGCLFVSAVVGLAAQSWLAFLLTLAVSVAVSVHSGGIRSQPALSRRPAARRNGGSR
jgi:hypothetical protein